MGNKVLSNDVFGFIKTKVDAHTMGLYTMANLLRDCGYKVEIANDDICEAIENLSKLNNYSLFKHWIEINNITRISFSYRLDPQDGCDYFMTMFELLKGDTMLSERGGPIKELAFAGLPDACKMVNQKTNGRVILFPGNETPIVSLRMYGVPESVLPVSLCSDNPYDNMRWDFAKRLVESERWKYESAQDHYGYKECGTEHDSYVARLEYAISRHSLPIIRTHSGPYNNNRDEALREYNSWCKDLAESKLLDILSIGSSQLTQSNFGENWEGKSNGGGVPINSELEYRIIKENSRPMLVRTYSGTKDILKLARIHERALNISWHALSFWWFNELDGRGRNSLLDNLKEHFETVRYAVATNKPVEPNVPHHFSFRGADDITYIITGYIAAKVCKKLGVRHLILQNMLNTPKYTSGAEDLAKSRAMIKLVRQLEDNNFHVSVQTRAGLEYFSPNLEEAKIQLAAVTCMMDDIDPYNDNSPEIVHVVNYSEAICLATPHIIKESIQITLSALKEYRLAKTLGNVPDMRYDTDICERTESLLEECRASIELLEKALPNLYTPEGFYTAFVEGFFPVPYLVDPMRKYPKATQWHTAMKNGGVRVIDYDGKIVYTPYRYRKIISQLQ